MMRGYFGVGAERISKARNLGTILRTANGFGASFVFTVQMHHSLRDINSADTSKGAQHLPFYPWPSLEEMQLPARCTLVGVELTDEAIPLPSFRHPMQAAYLFGPEKGSLSDEATAMCDHVIKIPTRFCVNVAVATAVILYDRMISMGTFENRPVMTGGPPPVSRWKKRAVSDE
ncbi:RNA methyltransferase [Aquisalinus luteolus]|uniref:rRNA methyltransferase n=2 Tax=Aquisalinus luteolus TaxID=1566827 RepID=A0A8J3A213_9PROT|nr:RNA methyltransferase [Aquisalinus luteolus]GGH97162.1 rRNA methyltransferase [Aquisalinus luteolus]